jgi:hypothetical protein
VFSPQADGTIVEKDARAIILQVLNALRYLNTPSAGGDEQVRELIALSTILRARVFFSPGSVLFTTI